MTHKLDYALLLLSFVLLIIGSYFLFSDGLANESIRSTKALWNLGHVLYFFILTFIFLKLKFLRATPYFKLCIWITVLAIALGAAIEMLQYGTARHTDIFDVMHDVLGSLIALALYRPTQSANAAKLVALFKVTVVLFIVLSLWPLSSALWDEAHARAQFPVLSDFSSPLEINRWSGNSNFQLASQFKHAPNALRIDFNTQKYSSLHLNYFERNWSDYQTFNIELYSPSKTTLPLTLKVFDAQHKPYYFFEDRLNLNLLIKQGWNTVSFPMKALEKTPKFRLMDLKNIVGFNLFTHQLKQPKTLYLKRVYLSHYKE